MDRDIAAYIEERLAMIRNMYSGTGLDSWPSEDEKDRLIELTDRLFVFISIALNFIADRKGNNPQKRLEEVLKKLGIHKSSPFAYLDGLYTGVVEEAFPDDADLESVEEMKSIIGSVVHLRDQLSPTALDNLLKLKHGTSMRSLCLLQSVISLPQSGDGVIQIIHHSFPDFLVNPTRCTKPGLVMDHRHCHSVLAKCCFRTMGSSLRRNVCRIPPDQITFLNSEVRDLSTRISTYLPSHVQYALRHWAHHLYSCKIDEEMVKLLKSFCDKHLLQWLEGLSIIGDTDVAIDALKAARRALMVRSRSGLSVQGTSC